MGEMRFRKAATCPSSYRLLEYRRGGLYLPDRTRVEIHLRACDFCNAELQLLQRLNTRCEEYRFTEIPKALRRFAEIALKRSATELTESNSRVQPLLRLAG